MNTPPTVLILGARGRFGSAAARAFAHAGWRVLAQHRPGGQPLPVAGVQWLAVDPHDTTVLAGAARGAAVVVQALSPEYTHRAWRRELLPLTQSAIDATRSLGATLMLPASVYNFGERMPAQLREDTPQAAETFKGRMRMASERLIEAATRDGRMKAVVIRGGDFFGSGRGSLLDMVIGKPLRSGAMGYPGPRGVPTAWAYLPDMARTFVKVAQQRDGLAAFETFHFAGYTLRAEDWQRALQPVAEEQGWVAPGQSLKVKGMPWTALRLLALAVPTLEAVAEMRYLWRTPHSLVDTRLPALVGPVVPTPFDVAVREALDDLGLIEAGARTAPALG